ncbi:hypothetical protein [Neoaquamicrobium sediminum]|uniref:hypothetical protein n=1 Tax=Neoaquamicrobium sediminum TaxID=1849104 RepID=UPI001FD3B5C5|nr:hypothetical protein [Mesorhizobium sediminum]
MILHLTAKRAAGFLTTGKELTMKSIILAGMFVLSASASWAQTTTSPQPAAPAAEAQTDEVAPQQGGPANLCQELVAFMKAPPPEPAAPAGAAKSAEPPAQQSASAGQTAPSGKSAATQGTTDADQAKADEETGSAQEITGQDGVATDAPKPGKDNAAASGSVECAAEGKQGCARAACRCDQHTEGGGADSGGSRTTRLRQRHRAMPQNSS